MNVASLELCKELYELSGLNDTFFIHQLQFKDDTPTRKMIVVDRETGHCGSHDHKETPAYDLGYLLRKLPWGVEITQTDPATENPWLARYFSDKDGITALVPHHLYADTPEDAAVKLAIELFKQGVLKHST